MKKQTELKLHRLKPAKLPHKKQLHFGHYWEHTRNRQTGSVQPIRNNTNFELKLKKRRPLWKDMMMFAATTMSVWGVSHVALNYSAFAEIANFKLQTSITNLEEKIAEKFKPAPIAKLKKVKTHQKEVKFEEQNSAKKTFQEMIVYPADNRIVLPRIGKNVPLISVSNNKNWKQLETTIQKGLQDGVVVHPISRNPGNMGNFFLTGHSSYYAWDNGRYKDVFALLHEVESGDEAIIYWKGKKYTYILNKSKIVPPTEVSVLKQPDDRSMITLMTCTPVGTNKNRLIWTGDLVSVE
jgi:LPXTG-site transpeptidase (sortase) family protein